MSVEDELKKIREMGLEKALKHAKSGAASKAFQNAMNKFSPESRSGIDSEIKSKQKRDASQNRGAFKNEVKKRTENARTSRNATRGVLAPQGPPNVEVGNKTLAQRQSSVANPRAPRGGGSLRGAGKTSSAQDVKNLLGGGTRSLSSRQNSTASPAKAAPTRNPNIKSVKKSGTRNLSTRQSSSSSTTVSKAAKEAAERRLRARQAGAR